ncbi:MAG: dienelactone hydrolase family protein [Deltaproteobacteria bacterium]
MPAEIHTEATQFESHGNTIRGYLARPTTAGPHAAVIIIHDVWGLSDHYRDIAERLAHHGFVAWAIDLYSREGPPADLADMEAVDGWIHDLPDRRVLTDLQMTVSHLASQSYVDGQAIAVAGFCMGGQYALMAACTLSGLAAAVSWYGMLRYRRTSSTSPEQPLDMARRLTVPWLGLYGSQDAIIPAADVDELRSVLEEEEAEFELVSYDGAGHAFFNDTRPDMYRPEAAADAWQRCLAFLGNG